VTGAEKHSWLPDQVSKKPAFGVQDIDNLREARRSLGSDLSLVKAKLPPLTELPDPTTIASIHADILTLKRLSTEFSEGGLPTLVVHEQSGQDRAVVCKRALEAVIFSGARRPGSALAGALP
jgi:hypothetical protein